MMNWSDWPEDPYVFPPPVGERQRRQPRAPGLKPVCRWGVAAIFLATGLIVTAIAFGSCVARLDAHHKPPARSGDVLNEVGGCGVATPMDSMPESEAQEECHCGLDFNGESGQPPILLRSRIAPIGRRNFRT